MVGPFPASMMVVVSLYANMKQRVGENKTLGHICRGLMEPFEMPCDTVQDTGTYHPIRSSSNRMVTRGIMVDSILIFYIRAEVLTFTA